MNPYELRIFDAFLSVIAGLGLLPAITRLMRQGFLNARENRIILIMCLMSTLFFVRAPYIVSDGPVFGALTFAVSLLLALAVMLYFEALLRRHYPFWFKLFIAIGMSIFLTLALTGILMNSDPALIAFGIFILVSNGCTMLFCIFRRRKELSTLENNIINASLISLVVIGPFFMTDISVLHLTDGIKLGPIGGLLFATIVFFNAGFYHRRGRILLDVILMALVSTVFTMATLLPMTFIDKVVVSRIFVMFFSLTLGFRIYSQSRPTDTAQQMLKFMQAIHFADKSSMLRFLVGLQESFNNVENKTIFENELVGYDLTALREFFVGLGTRVLNQAQIIDFIYEEKRRLHQDSHRLDVCEQLFNLLQEHNMTHICWLVDEPMCFLLLNMPLIGQTDLIEAEVNLIGEVSKLIHGGQA